LSYSGTPATDTRTTGPALLSGLRPVACFVDSRQ